MKRNVRKAFTQLKNMGVPVVEIKEGNAYFLVSAEDTESYKWLDYYGEFRGGYPWVNPELEKVVAQHSLELQWQNPGCMGVYDD